jgi:hypothetical protein
MKRFCFGMLLALVIASSSAAEYFQDFTSVPVGATELMDGSECVGCSVQDGALKELRLIEKTPSLGTAFYAPPITEDVKVLAFSAKFNLGMSFEASNPGEGFQFVFGKTNSDVGLAFEVKTRPGSVEYLIRANGKVVTNRVATLTATTKRQFFEIDWKYTNGLSVRVDGATLISGRTDEFRPSFDDRFAWVARNGAGASEITLDNIAVVAGGTLQRVAGDGFFASQRNTSFGPRKAFDDDNNEAFAVFDAQSGFVGGNFSPARRLMYYAVTSALDAPDPHRWTIEGATASTGPWTPLASGDWNFAHRKETRVWPITNRSAALPFVQFSFATNNSAIREVYVGEVRLFEFVPVQPPFAADVSMATLGTAALLFSGPPTSNYVAQVTTDFRQWTDLSTNTIPESGAWSVNDPNATNAMRFYRLRSN